MILWLLYLFPAAVVTLACYMTNWLVLFFADEEGELPSIWHLWQTWDDSCDSSYFMHNVCPSWLDYGYDEHYIEFRDTDFWTGRYGKERYFSVIRPDAVWTTKQRIQRYFCRLWWLTRNCAYGWCFYIFGADLTHIKWHIQEQDHFLGSVGSWLTEPFCYKNESRICSWLSWKIYIGWKSYPGNTSQQRCMLAYRILLKFGGNK